MPDPEAVFWDRLDLREAAFTGDEVATWPPAFRDALTRPGVLCRTSNATHIACDACDTGHVEEVQQVEGPEGRRRFYLVCPENGRVQVDERRLLRWAVNFQTLATVVAEEVGCTGTVEMLKRDRIWVLGRLVRAAVARNVVMCRGLTWEDGGQVVVASQRIRIASPPLVLAIGRLPSDTFWGKQVPPVLGLNEVLALDGRISACLDAVDNVLGIQPAQPRVVRRKRRRASRAETIDALTKAMAEHLRAARDHAHSLKERDQVLTLLPRPTRSHLAGQVNVSPPTVGRCLTDPAARQLQVYWEMANVLEQVMRFKG